MNEVVIHEVRDKSVERKIAQTARNLKRKYNKKRVVNEKLLKPKSVPQRVIEIILDVILGLLVVCSSIVCFSSINSALQGVSPSFMGVSNLTVESGSMVNSGLNIGDTVIVRTVDTHTLNEGDIIAFYVYAPDYRSFNINSCIRVKENVENKYVFNVRSLLGFQTDAIKTAAKSGSRLIIHHIRSIYEDDNGVRWFKTYGSANVDTLTGKVVDDVWFVSENMVLGLYDDSETAKFYATIVKSVSTSYGLIIVLIPVFLLVIIIIAECVNDVELAKLELDCVEEKRKITDPVCVKNNVGFNMDLKTKFKILAQATEENRNEYVALLWRGGTVPDSIRKYVTKKNILLSYNRKMLELNRTCEAMFKEKQSDGKVAKYYLKEKERLEKELDAQVRQMRKLQSNKKMANDGAKQNAMRTENIDKIQFAKQSTKQSTKQEITQTAKQQNKKNLKQTNELSHKQNAKRTANIIAKQSVKQNAKQDNTYVVKKSKVNSKDLISKKSAENDKNLVAKKSVKQSAKQDKKVGTKSDVKPNEVADKSTINKKTNQNQIKK